jgi:hypothetical protein
MILLKIGNICFDTLLFFKDLLKKYSLYQATFIEWLIFSFLGIKNVLEFHKLVESTKTDLKC